ncbi:CoB--CoM heterodisulfide reductase iron-sulfur subunit B family protein [Chloroflexota bacterium]
MDKLKYSYYPGCSLEATAKEYDMSMREVAKMLDVELIELKDWNCCGASSGHCTNYELSLALPARNLAIAEKEGLDLAVACAACFLRFKQTNYDLKKDDDLRQKVEEEIGIPYKGNVEVRHLVDIFAREVGLENIKERVKKPLEGLKLAAYYGCYLVRPPEVTQFDDPENPRIMDDLLTALGAETVDWSHKVECCGGNLLLARADVVIKLVGDICRSARDAGASAIVTACPLCQANLDMRQSGADTVPILHFSELMGLALGVSGKTTGGWWKRHLTSPEKVLSKLSLV